MSDAAATKQDIANLQASTNASIGSLRDDMKEMFEDIMQVLGTMMTRIDDRFIKIEGPVMKLQTDFRELKAEFQVQREDTRRIFTYLDSVEKRLEIQEQERLVMGHQLDRLNTWTRDLARHIGYQLSAE
ncbi:MAG: hypothetical protein WA843_04490 [Candidatus Saccharimonadales bacterium]